MFRTSLSLAIAAVATAAFTSAASAGCYSCYTPPPQPCTTCYQVQTVPPQYRTVMVPKTVMVAPEGVAYERIAPQYATQERTQMVSPGYSYYAPVQQTCSTCGGGYGYGYGRGYGY